MVGRDQVLNINNYEMGTNISIYDGEQAGRMAKPGGKPKSTNLLFISINRASGSCCI